MPPEDKKEILEAIAGLSIKIDDLSQESVDLRQTVENMAASAANSFHEVREEIAVMATKDDLAQVDTKLSAKIDNLQNRLDVNAGLDRRVDQLTSDMIQVKKVVGIA